MKDFQPLLLDYVECKKKGVVVIYVFGTIKTKVKTARVAKRLILLGTPKTKLVESAGIPRPRWSRMSAFQTTAKTKMVESSRYLSMLQNQLRWS